jgi:hypothetical protein
MILYFGTTSNFGTGGTFGFNPSIYSGQSISIYDQAKATNGRIRDVARIINSPFALNYATVSPAGYTFPTKHVVMDNGIETMTKFYTGGSFTNSTDSFANGFYIFATVRGSASQSNTNATFTIADHAATTATVIGEGRSRPISGGVFTDTFATAYDVHIYRIH